MAGVAGEVDRVDPSEWSVGKVDRSERGEGLAGWIQGTPATLTANLGTPHRDSRSARSTYSIRGWASIQIK